MDIGGANDQTNQILSYNHEYGSATTKTNQVGINKMNTTIKNAKTKQSLMKGYDEGGAGVSGVSSLLSGAKTYGDAKNFDSEVAGFGKGKGASGYMQSQGQLFKGRMGQAGQKTQVALGVMDEGDTAKSGAALGLTQTKMGTTLQYSRASATEPLKAKSVPQMQTGLGDASKVADDTAQGKAVAKASGGLLSAGKGGAEGGLAGGIIKKAGKFVSDMPAGQLGAVADIGGKAIGMFSAGKGIYDDIHGDWSTDTGAQKVANVGDIVAGGLDAVSMAMPMLAPVGAVASGISALLDIGAQAEDTKKTIAGAHTTGLTTTTAGSMAPSLSSAGLVAKQQLSAY